MRTEQTKSDKAIYCPQLGRQDSLGEMRDWYENVDREMDCDHLCVDEKAYFRDYYAEAGLLRKWRKPFFNEHFVNSFREASEFLLHREDPVILDLGCGTGTQSLYFALRGARVLALDLDRMALQIMRKRLIFYEQLTGRNLKVTFLERNACEFDFKSVGPIDSIYSMFAFNIMQPTEQLLDQLIRAVAPGGRFAVIDGSSSCWLPRLFPHRRRGVQSPQELRTSLEQRGFRTVRHKGAIVFPPIAWAVVPSHILRPIDLILRTSWLAALSHQILAQRD